MSGGYRELGNVSPEPEKGVICPECQTAMRPQGLSGKTLDLCPHCGGIWIDEGDGGIAEACRAARDALGSEPPVPPHGPERICPHCAIALYVAAKGERPFLRCPSCAGAWISRRIAKAISDAVYPSDDPSSEERTPGAFQAFLEIVRGWEAWKG